MFVTVGTLAGARLAVTDRRGGVSAAPYDGLNLGGHVGDDPAAVQHNRGALAAELGLAAGRLVFMSQVHGARVAQVGAQPSVPAAAPTSARAGDRTSGGSVPEADALMTTSRGLALTVLVADCAPVLLASSGPDVIAVAHAGRRGLHAGVVPATVAAMQRAGADAGRIRARVGPAICGGCYEVSPLVQDEVARTVPEARSTTRAGTTGLDIRAAVVAQLVAAGVGSVEVDPACTAEHRDLYSYRRDGVTGRFAGLTWLPELSDDA